MEKCKHIRTLWNEHQQQRFQYRT